jgi:hypothetical protein
MRKMIKLIHRIILRNLLILGIKMGLLLCILRHIKVIIKLWNFYVTMELTIQKRQLRDRMYSTWQHKAARYKLLYTFNL